MTRNLILSSLLSLMLIMLLSCKKADQADSEPPAFKHLLTEEAMAHWEGDEKYWDFKDGILTGEITPETILTENTFFVLKNPVSNDFEMKVEYRISSEGNSGINYRSSKISGKQFVLKGYQADIDGKNEFTGQIYDEKGRGFLAKRNQLVLIKENNTVNVLESIGNKDSLFASIRNNGWNTYHIIAQGNTLIHIINNQLMSLAIDKGKNGQEKGLLGLQLHFGPPMKVEFRNLQLKQFPD